MQSPVEKAGMVTDTANLLEIDDLHIHFHTLLGTVKAVNGIRLKLSRGGTLGVVGESGSGKSVMAMSLLQLIPMPPGELVKGSALFLGNDLLKMSVPEIQAIRGNRIGMIFQEPMTSLNPVFTIGNQIGESFRRHCGVGYKEAREKAIEMLDMVGIPAPRKRIMEYPHQLSGGMRQRAMIAMALSCEPDLLIADEPTTALDVTVQAQIIDLMKALQKKIDMGIIMITHNLGVVAETADEVAVMYCGRIVEYADVDLIFHHPLHPYTRLLLQSVPKLFADGPRSANRLKEIPGMVPSLHDLPAGCVFQPRCDRDIHECRQRIPELKEVEPGHFVACNLMESA